MIDDDLPPGATIPPQAGAKDGPVHLRSRSAAVEIQSVRYSHGYVDKDSNCFGWVGIDRLDVLAGTKGGEHVARYLKAYIHPGAGPDATAWSLCAETTDLNGLGNAWGAEIDLMSIGEPAPGKGRIGLGIVTGEACLRTPDGKNAPPTYKRVRLTYGVVGLPFRRVVAEDGVERIVPDNVYHDCWLTTFVPCTVFSAAPPGSWRTYDRNMNVGNVFVEWAGFTLYGRRDVIGDPPDFTRAALAIQNDTGEVLQFGIQIVPQVPLEFRPSVGESKAAWDEKLRKRREWIAANTR